MKQRALFIGTSPLMLMRALTHAENGDQITIIDRAKAVGGSWSTPPFVGLDSVECGVHLLENRPHFYSALRQLGIRLERDEKSVTIWRARRLSMAPARVVFHGLVALNAARRGQFDRSSRVAVSAIRSFRNLNTNFEYPTAGCRELHERLTEKLAQHGVSPILGIHVNRIEIDEAGVRCETTDGRLQVDRVVLGSRAHAPLFVHSKLIEASIEHERIVSIVIRGYDPNRKLTGYVEFLRDPYIKRIRDVSRYCLPPLERGGEFVLCIQLRTSGEVLFRREGTEAIANYLLVSGFLTSAARVTDSGISVYAYQTLTDSSLRAIERQSMGRIYALRTTDFADGFEPATEKNTK